MLIGALATATGVAAKTLRFWEAEGLLQPPARTPAGYRDYPDSAVDRVRFVVQAKAAGLTLGEIGEIIAIREGGHPPCHHAATLVADRLAHVDRRIAELTETQATLRSIQSRLDRLAPINCDTSTVCSAIASR